MESSRNRPRDQKRGAGGEAADQRGLQSAARGSRAGVVAFDKSEREQREQRQSNGPEERNRDVGLLDEGAGDVGSERDQAAGHIRSRNRQRADERTFRI